jgi:hypothetical protein
MAKTVFFGRSDGSEDDLQDPFPKQKSQIWIQVYVETVPM